MSHQNLSFLQLQQLRSRKGGYKNTVALHWLTFEVIVCVAESCNIKSSSLALLDGHHTAALVQRSTAVITCK